MIAITARCAGGVRSRADVCRWEDRRIDAAARKLGVEAPARGPIEARREQWAQTKLGYGADALLERLSRDVAWSDRIAALGAAAGSRRRSSVTELNVPTGTADAFVTWFSQATDVSDEAAMVRSCPDHFVIRTGARGQEVCETTGGSPFATHFFVDYEDVSSLVTTADPAFPYQLAGVARDSRARAIGGVRHQFRPLDGGGFQARLTVEFPVLTPVALLRAHEWHLACEFSNWIEASLAAM